MNYFAYGSFLDQETLRTHCPNARFLGRAWLPNFRLEFNFLSHTYGGGVTSVEFAPGEVVHGVLYDISPEEMAYLDTVEDVPQGHYYRQTVAVVDEKGRILQAEAYRTTHPAGPFTPTRRYLGLMLKGAREHGLDPAYIQALEDLYASLPA